MYAILVITKQIALFIVDQKYLSIVLMAGSLFSVKTKGTGFERLICLTLALTLICVRNILERSLGSRFDTLYAIHSVESNAL